MKFERRFNFVLYEILRYSILEESLSKEVLGSFKLNMLVIKRNGDRDSVSKNAI